jgi:hypothetical protein
MVLLMAFDPVCHAAPIINIVAAGPRYQTCSRRAAAHSKQESDVCECAALQLSKLLLPLLVGCLLLLVLCCQRTRSQLPCASPTNKCLQHLPVPAAQQMPHSLHYVHAHVPDILLCRTAGAVHGTHYSIPL